MLSTFEKNIWLFRNTQNFYGHWWLVVMQSLVNTSKWWQCFETV